MRELALFACAGGGILGGALLGWECVGAVEIEPYCRAVLNLRQRDRTLPKFPIYNDVRTFDGHAWRGRVDVISGGFPCQDISSAGKGAGIEGERSGLWKEYARIVGEVEPQWVFIENSPLLRGRGLTTVLQDLAALGYDAAWDVLGACDVGAPHRRERMWIVAHTSQNRCYAQRKTGGMGSAPRAKASARHQFAIDALSRDWWGSEPAVARVANGVADRVDRLSALGNGQVPAVAALAFRTLSARLLEAHQ